MKEIKREPNLPAPTDCFGNAQLMAVWYECPRCMQKSPLTRQWVGLTDEEIVAAIYEAEGFNFGLDNGNVSDRAVIRYVRIVEAKLKEKNHG